jgi:bacterioferritin (cytochrome b1)
MNEGRIDQLIKQKRLFLRQGLKDYSSGGNDMLDDVEGLLNEARAEITHNLQLASCLKEEEGEAAWLKECLSMFNSWYEKWFGKL